MVVNLLIILLRYQYMINAKSKEKTKENMIRFNQDILGSRIINSLSIMGRRYKGLLSFKTNASYSLITEVARH